MYMYKCAVWVEPEVEKVVAGKVIEQIAVRAREESRMGG